MLQESEKRIRRDDAVETCVPSLRPNGVEGRGVAVVTSPATYSRVVDLTVDPFGVIAKEPHARGVAVDHQGAADPPGAARVEFKCLYRIIVT